MKTTDFAEGLHKYMTEHLTGVCGCAPLTLESYKQTFIHYLNFMNSEKKKSPNKILMSDFNYRNILQFLEWLEKSCGSSVSTRNQRLSAIKSLAKFLMYEYPEYLYEYQLILGIKQKRSKKPEISYIKADGIRVFLEQIDLNAPLGRRDYTMFSIMFTTGIRVSELIQIKAKDISLQEPRTIKVHGKGSKTRFVPIMKQTVPIIEQYLKENRLNRPENLEEYVFQSKGKRPLTRQAVNYQVSKYTKMANEIIPGVIPEDFSPHKIRHSVAMELLASDVDLIYIRDLLGHSSVTTTEVYARTDSSKRREALEAASRHIVEREPAKWDGNEDLKDWLKSFNH